ncbi:MAG: hypothetical protein GY715_07010 [Planctomycetes bacterium]|nr:hypothetical protein [Planctomycetota bacterium]
MTCVVSGGAPSAVFQNPIPPRTCGGCTGCCTVMAVGSIGKPAGTPCVHACHEGCAIYERRPAQCKSDFYCLWMRDTEGLIGEEHRPDRVGLVLTDDSRSPDGRPTLVAREIHPGAADRSKGRHLIEFLRQFVRVTIVPARSEPVVMTVEGRGLTR